MIPFDTVSPGIRPAEHRNKTAEEAKAHLDALPAEYSDWKRRLPPQDIGALAVVARANKAAGDTACVVHRTDIASAIGVTPERAERVLARLVEVGAVECRHRLAGQAPHLRAVMTPPASPPSIAQKGERPPTRKSTGTADAKLKAGLVGLRNHEEPAKLDLRAGIVGADPRR